MAPAAVVKAQPWFLPFDSQGNAYAVHPKGITELSTGQTYFAENSINYQVNMHTSWRKPQCHFMDSHDNLWLGFGFGEWGGEVLAFSCTQKKFLTLHTDSFIMALWPIKSFFEDASGVYLTAGLMHFSTQGCLARFDAAQKLHTLFESEGRRGDPETAGEYIGPGTYNPYDGHIYFYSQNGIFRGDPKGDLSSIDRWQKVLQPQLSWRSGQPDAVVACVGGGSNAMGIFYPYIDHEKTRLIGVEAAGEGLESGRHSASLQRGSPGVLHGNRTYILQDDNGQITETHSASAGLDYPGVGPEHAWLKDIGRAEYVGITDKEALEAFHYLCRTEGIIPALESSHAVAHAMKLAKTMRADQSILVNLSGRGDKDIGTVADLSNADFYCRPSCRGQSVKGSEQPMQ
eukprot:gene45715-56965_t